MTFFDTVAGQRFTEGTLPSLVRELEVINHQKQYVKTFAPKELQTSIEEELKKGAKVVSMCPAYNWIVVVFTKGGY